MMLRILLVCILALPSLVNAEIYKWKDSDGKIRYSDMPPPSNIKQESLYGKKIPKPADQASQASKAPLAPVEGDINATIKKNKASTEKDNLGDGKEKTEKPPLTKEEAAAKRAKEADKQKKENEAKQAELKIKQENCKAAQSNLATYTNGGRIVKTNANGEREYLGDAEISQNRADAEKDVGKYCD